MKHVRPILFAGLAVAALAGAVFAAQKQTPAVWVVAGTATAEKGVPVDPDNPAGEWLVTALLEDGTRTTVPADPPVLPGNRYRLGQAVYLRGQAGAFGATNLRAADVPYTPAP